MSKFKFEENIVYENAKARGVIIKQESLNHCGSGFWSLHLLRNRSQRITLVTLNSMKTSKKLDKGTVQRFVKYTYWLSCWQRMGRHAQRMWCVFVCVSLQTCFLSNLLPAISFLVWYLSKDTSVRVTVMLVHTHSFACSTVSVFSWC